MDPQHVFVGLVMVVLSGVGLWHARWLVDNTRKGARLVRWFGEENAIWILRCLLLFSFVMGALLALGVVQPLQHGK